MEHKNCCEKSEAFRGESREISPQERLSRERDRVVLIGSAMISLAFLVSAGIIAYSKNNNVIPKTAFDGAGSDGFEEKVIPQNGFIIPARFEALGAKLVQDGVIDRDKFDALYANFGGPDKEIKAVLEGSGDDQLKITPENSGQVLNLLWALGLANKNPILDKGPMQDSKYGGPGRFASTAGWTIAKGKAMNHYSSHELIRLTAEEQALVERVAKNIYRPCCGNSTYFPDCNHGMAMLGLLELLASQGASEENMYRTALAVNSYWFPETYLTIAQYLANKNASWDAVDPKMLLSERFSSIAGYQRIVSEIQTPAESGSSNRPSGGCGV